MNSKFIRKRSTSAYSSSKKVKIATMPNSGIPLKEVPMHPEDPSDRTSYTDGDHDEIPTGDWLTAICHSLGEVPLIRIPSPDVLPQLIIDTPGTAPLPADAYARSDASTTKTQAHNKSSRTISKTLRTWILDDCLLVSLVQTDCKLHIHLRKCSIIDRTLNTSKMGILMNIPTYVDFKEKIGYVDTIDETSSVICNNQLAIFSRRGELIMHQIFYHNEFKLKLTPLVITYSTLLKIRDLTYDVDRAIENALVSDVLPEKILEQSDALPTHYPDLIDEFILSLQQEIGRNVSKIFKCLGCKINDMAQSNHDCMTTSYKDKLNYVGTNAFLMLDARRVVEDLKVKGILECFRKAFFKDLCYSDIEHRLGEEPNC